MTVSSTIMDEFKEHIKHQNVSIFVLCIVILEALTVPSINSNGEKQTQVLRFDFFHIIFLRISR